MKTKELFIFNIPKQTWLTIMLISFIGASFNFLLPCLTTIRNSLKTSDLLMKFSLILGPALSIFSCIFFAVLRHNKKNILLAWCIFSFLTGSFICGISTNIMTFLTGRSFQILGDSGISIIAFSFLSDFHRDKELGKVLGISAIINALANIFSPLMGAWVLNQINWRWNFFLLAIPCFPFLYSFYLYNRKNLSSEESAQQFSYEIFIMDSQHLIKNHTFLLACLTPALYATIGSLFDVFSPFFYMDICNFSSHHYSFVRLAITLVGITGSLIYLHLLKYNSMQNILWLGTFVHVFYMLGMTWLLISKETESPYLLLSFYICQVLSASFVGPIGMVKALSCFKGKENISMAFFSLARNILSTFFSCFALFFFDTGIYPIISLILFLSFIALLFLIRINYMRI